MMNREQRENEKFRKHLQKQFVDEAQTSASPVNVDADALWHKIDQRLTRETISVVKPRHNKGRPTLWALPLAAALALMVVMGQGAMEEPTPKKMNLTIMPLEEVPLETMVTTHREPLQTPSRQDFPRCDQTRQSCLYVAFL